MFSKNLVLSLCALSFPTLALAAAAPQKRQFGNCSTPQIKFAAGLDGRTETAFAPVDQRSYPHGSAQDIDEISGFICQQLQTACKANSNAVQTCKNAASKAGNTQPDKSGAQADVFNAAFGINTNFKNVKPVGNGGGNNNADPQKSLTLDPRVIAPGFAQDGQQVPAEGQVPSLTSTNNYINFCLTVNKPLTDGKQITGGSCNPAPIGVIASTANMPSSKFTFPANLEKVKANKAFTIKMAIRKIETGNFVNAQSNYYSAPQQVAGNGNIIGHTHVVIEKLDSLTQTAPTDPTRFAFFKGVNGKAVNGVVTADVTSGLPAGFYRLASINSAANHQPVVVAVAQHGSLDDMVYFTVA